MLDERVAIVTGGGRGVGRAHATRLAAYDAAVVVDDAGVATDGAATDETPGEAVVAQVACYLASPKEWSDAYHSQVSS